MNCRFFNGIGLIAAIVVMSGCGSSNNAECSSESTLQLVRQSIRDNAAAGNSSVGYPALSEIEPDQLSEYFVLNDARPLSFDENIGRYECQATLNVPFTDAGRPMHYRVAVPYSSQLVDGGDQIVQVSMSMFHLMGVGSAAYTRLKEMQGADSPSTPGPAESVVDQPESSDFADAKADEYDLQGDEGVSSVQAEANPTGDAPTEVVSKPVVSGPSFDCNKAASRQEIMICGDATLSRLDKELALAYKNAKNESRGNSEFTAQQRSWITQVRNGCKDTECLVDAYEHRLRELTQ